MPEESQVKEIDQSLLSQPESTAQANGMGIPQDGDPPIPTHAPPSTPGSTEEGNFNPDSLGLPKLDTNQMAGVPKETTAPVPEQQNNTPEEPGDQKSASTQQTPQDQPSSAPPTTTDVPPNAGQDKGSSDGNQTEAAIARNEALTGFVSGALSKHLGRDVEPIEGLTEENFLEKVAPLLNQQGELHPEVVKMQKALDGGSEFSDVINAYNAVSNMDSMDDRDLVANQVRSQYGKTSEEDQHGMTQDEVEDEVNSMSDREVRRAAIKIRKEGKAQGDPMEALTQQRAQQRDDYNAKLISDYDAEIDGVLGGVVTDNKVYGLEMEQSELSMIVQDAKVGMRPDPKTGVSEFVNELKDNESFTKLAILYYAAKKGQINANITKAKEKVKTDFLGLLDNTPQQNRNVGDGGEGSATGKIDTEALRRPEAQVRIA